MKYKTLIVSNLLAVAAVQYARNFSLLSTEPDQIDQDTQEFSITYRENDRDALKLIGTRLSEQYFSVSFAGDEELLKLIETNGWESSAQAVYNFLSAIDPNGVPTDFQFHTYDTPEYTALVDQDAFVEIDELEQLLGIETDDEATQATLNLAEAALDQLNEMVEGAIQDTTEAVEEAAHETAEILEEAVIEEETQATKPGLFSRACRFVANRRVAATLVVGTAVVGIVGGLLLKDRLSSAGVEVDLA
ncbi:hypothetical protein LUCX_117 [Xanthomonas phage vB_XciM_LucasX]|nr:hypothetical protein LUCX_117 [Xanthomonas phage vB_XciM_LucasX]